MRGIDGSIYCIEGTFSPTAKEVSNKHDHEIAINSVVPTPGLVKRVGYLIGFLNSD